MQQTYLDQQLKAMAMTPLTDAQEAVDDLASCSVWLDNSTVLVGTACNSLLLLQPHRGSHALLQYPRPPTHRLTSDAPANPYHIGHNGQHALAVSPGGHWLVTGGQVSHDILLWQLAQEDHYPLEERQQQGLQLDTPAARRSSAPSRTVLHPVQTLTAHTDWVFDMAWLDDSRFLSTSLDGTIKLWQVPQEAAAAAAGGAGVVPYSTRAAPCQASLQPLRGEGCSIQYDQQQQLVVSLSMHGSLGYWTPELQWCGGCRLPGGDCTALRVHGNLTAVAIGLGTWLLDSRVSEPVASIAAVGAGAQRQPDLGQQQAAAAAAAVQQNREQIRWQQVAAGMLPSDDDDADDDEMLHSMQHLFGEGLVPLGRPASVPAAGFTVEATLTGGIALAEGINEVRSLSLQHHLLGIGALDGLFFHDLRRLSSQRDAAAAAAAAAHHSGYSPVVVGWQGGNFGGAVAEYDSSWVQTSTGSLPARVGCMGLPDPGEMNAVERYMLQLDGGVGHNTVGVYTHCWDPTGTQLFVGGGGMIRKGCSLALFS